jgi:hypothetical protein
MSSGDRWTGQVKFNIQFNSDERVFSLDEYTNSVIEAVRRIVCRPASSIAVLLSSKSVFSVLVAESLSP